MSGRRPISAPRARWLVTASSTERGSNAAAALLKWRTLATPGETEEVVGLLLEGRRPRGESERLPGGDGGNEGVSSERGEIVEEGSEAVDRKAVVGPAGGLLGNGGRGALGFGDDAGAQRFGGILVGIVVEHGRQALAHVPL